MATQVRAQDMSAREFKGLLTKIHNTGRRLDQLIAQGIAYCAFHHVSHGNKAPWDALIESAPQFARKIIRDAKKACDSVDRADIETALPDIESGVQTQLEERRTKGAQKKADDDDKNGDVESFSLTHTVNRKPERMYLTEEEYNAAMEAVQALRESKRGDIDKVAKLQQMENNGKRKTA